MTLNDYLNREGLSATAFANEIGISPHTVMNVLRGGLPAGTVIEKIMAATDYQVLPNDFFDIPESALVPFQGYVT